MRMLNAASQGFSGQLSQLLDRVEEQNNEVEIAVRRIIDEVRRHGNTAVLEYTSEFDHCVFASEADLELDPIKIDQIADSVSDELAWAIKQAASRILDYHSREISRSWQIEEADGTRLGQKITPLERVGVYVPGGKACYPSSVLMTAIPATVAGVSEIIMTVPTPMGEINPSLVCAARAAGVHRIFMVGGAQAVAALAYGTETIPPVDKIVGPGNIWVATAKKLVFGKVGIDMIAGPSEVVIICDDSVDPDWVAMDLFAQAEHDQLAQSIAITDSREVADAVMASVQRLLPQMERREIIETALNGQGAIILTENLEQAAELSNLIAPEHLELMVADPDCLLPGIQHAGAIFMGQYSAESLGDYCAGPNHVLPTAGTARFSSPLGVYDFQKRSSVIHASPSGAAKMAQIASVLARSEGLTGHARSAEYRLID